MIAGQVACIEQKAFTVLGQIEICLLKKKLKKRSRSFLKFLNNDLKRKTMLSKQLKLK